MIFTCFKEPPMTRHNKLSLSTLASLLALSLAPAAHAAPTDTFEVKTKVKEVCSIVASDIVLPEYDPTDAADLTQTSDALEVRCSKGTTYTVYLVSTGTVVSSGVRTMKSAANESLTYTLSPSAGTAVDNDDAFASGTSTTNAPMTLPVTVTVAALQDVTALADFSDTVTSNVDF
jgi:spore coat protein U-like protein